jgi:GNAT superfamily N-acetyltransferase
MVSIAKRVRLGHSTCPVVTFRRRSPPKGSGIRGVLIEAVADKRDVVGHIIVVKENDVPYVSDIRVLPQLQRCGLGTKLYEQAAQFACKAFKKPLHSSIERSAMSDRFWQKQVAKGRAVCVARTHEPPAEQPDWVPVPGRSGCVRYRLTCPAPTDLSKHVRVRR